MGASGDSNEEVVVNLSLTLGYDARFNRNIYIIEPSTKEFP
jgi:hypothetical protein